MNIIELLDRPIAFHRCLVEITGSCNGALLLSQAIYWQNRPTRESKNGWWYKSREEWKEETGLSRKELETARRGCSGILLWKKKGIPPYTYYKVDSQELEKRLLALNSDEPIIRTESYRSYGPKGAVHTDRNVQTICTETNTETKPDIKVPSISKGSLEEIKAYCLELGLPDSDGEWFFYKCEGNGWTNGGKPIRDWRATIRAWKTAGYMPSQKTTKPWDRGQKPYGYKTMIDQAMSTIENFKPPETGLNDK